MRCWMIVLDASLSHSQSQGLSAGQYNRRYSTNLGNTTWKIQTTWSIFTLQWYYMSRYTCLKSPLTRLLVESTFKLGTKKPWASYQIRKIAVCACTGNAGYVSPPPRVSDPDMHCGTCVTHVPWCMPGSLTLGFLCEVGGGETFPAFSAHAQLGILRIWQ